MKNIVLRTNATPIYAFLSRIEDYRSQEGSNPGKKVLDCGAGGPRPPLILFHQHGYETTGIDFSDDSLKHAKNFCEQHKIDLDIRKGDMRELTFEEGTFDFVYEHYSMCHLGKSDTAKAIKEMHRVLKVGGLGFLGVISTDTWPKSIFGKEKDVPGEFWNNHDGDYDYFHTMFTDDEANRLVSDWEILAKEKRCISMLSEARGITMDEWMEIDDEVRAGYPGKAWEQQYEKRENMFKYVHRYYFLKKITGNSWKSNLQTKIT